MKKFKVLWIDDNLEKVQFDDALKDYFIIDIEDEQRGKRIIRNEMLLNKYSGIVFCCQDTTHLIDKVKRHSNETIVCVDAYELKQEQIFLQLLSHLRNTPIEKVDNDFQAIFAYIRKYWVDAEMVERELRTLLNNLYDEDIRGKVIIDSLLNKQRVLLEMTFKTCLHHGIITSNCFNESGQPILDNCARFIAGPQFIDYLNPNLSSKINVLLPLFLRESLWTLLKAGHFASHNINKHSWRLLMSYAMRLGELFLWLGDYIEDLDFHNKYNPFSDYEGKVMKINKADDGTLHCDICTFLPNDLHEGDLVVLSEVDWNTNLKYCLRYPYFAKNVIKNNYGRI